MEAVKQFNFQIKGIEILETSIIEPKNRIDTNTVFGFDLQRKIYLQQIYHLENESKVSNEIWKASWL